MQIIGKSASFVCMCSINSVVVGLDARGDLSVLDKYPWMAPTDPSKANEIKQQKVIVLYCVVLL